MEAWIPWGLAAGLGVVMWRSISASQKVGTDNQMISALDQAQIDNAYSAGRRKYIDNQSKAGRSYVFVPDLVQKEFIPTEKKVPWIAKEKRVARMGDATVKRAKF